MKEKRSVRKKKTLLELMNETENQMKPGRNGAMDASVRFQNQAFDEDNNDIGRDEGKPPMKRQRSRNKDQDEISLEITETILENVEYVYLTADDVFNPEEEKVIPLTFDKFSDWFHIMKFDDFTTYDMLMGRLNSGQKEVLFSGRFLYNKPPRQLKVNKMDRMAEFGLPLNIALSCLSMNVINRMLRDEVDVMKKDVGMANIFHVLVIAASEKRQREDDFLKLLQLILKHIHLDDTKKMLLEENSVGYRPLELAARMGVFAIFREIFNLDGHLVENSFEAGLNTYSVYNLTEYENFESHRRFLRSPLRLIGYTTSEGYDSLKKNSIMKLESIERWYDLVRNRNFAVLLIWWIFRTILLTLMTVTDFTVMLSNECTDLKAIGDANETALLTQCLHVLSIPDGESNRALFAVVCCFFILVMDVFEFLSVMVDKERRIAYRGITSLSVDFTAWTPFYRLCQFIQVLLGAVTPFVASIYSGLQAFTVMLIMKALSLPLIMMSILYLFEPAPSLGGFAIALQKMIESIFAFVIFLVPVLVTFATFFQSVTGQSSTYGFVDMSRSMYLLFGLEIGTFDFGTDPGYVIAIVHVTYFFVTSVLLMNYLVAVMTAATDNDDEDREIIIFLRRLNLVMLAQERYGQWFWRLWFKLRGAKTIRVYAEEDA